MESTKVRPSARDAIIDAGIEQLNQNPTASLQAIAVRAGVGRATLHRHFGSREELINCISVQCMDEMEAAILAAEKDGASPVERLANLFSISIPMGHRYNFLASNNVMDEETKRRYKNQLVWLEALVEELRGDNLVSERVPTSWVVAQIDQLVWTGWRSVTNGELTSADAAKLAQRTLLQGIGG